MPDGSQSVPSIRNTDCLIQGSDRSDDRRASFRNTVPGCGTPGSAEAIAAPRSGRHGPPSPYSLRGRRFAIPSEAHPLLVGRNGRKNRDAMSTGSRIAGQARPCGEIADDISMRDPRHQTFGVEDLQSPPHGLARHRDIVRD